MVPLNQLEIELEYDESLAGFLDLLNDYYLFRVAM